MWQKLLNAYRGNVYDIVLMEVWVSGGLARAQALVNSDLLLSTEKHLLPPGLFIPLDFPMSFLFRESSLLILKDTLEWNEYWREFCTWMTHQGSNCSCSFWRKIKIFHESTYYWQVFQSGHPKAQYSLLFQIGPMLYFENVQVYTYQIISLISTFCSL